MRVCAVALLLCCAGGSAAAQICAGFPSYQAKPFSFGVGGTTTGAWKDYSAGVGAGHSSGLFVGAGAGMAEGGNLNAHYWKASAGFDITLDEKKEASVCPVASITHTIGPNFNDVAENHPVLVKSVTNTYVGGISFGVILNAENSIALIPTAELTFVSPQLTLSDGVYQLKDRDNHLNYTFGLSLILYKVLTARPWLSFPSGLKDGQGTMGLAARLNFGGKQSAQ